MTHNVKQQSGQQPTMSLAELADYPELFRAAKEYRTLTQYRRG